MSLKECSEPFPEATGIKEYRYFNQPIEQIPGFEGSKAQILFHTANKGLYWQTVPECVEVTKCIKIESASAGNDDFKIKAEKLRIRPLQDLGELDEPVDCYDFPTEAIDVVTCIRLEGQNLVIERKRVLVVKELENTQTSCENISVYECTTPSPT